MLKKRVIAILTLKEGRVVQSIGFRRYLPIGRPEVAVEYLNNWDIDEIALVGIDARADGKIDVDLVRRVSDFCQVPLTYGGGIRTVEEMTALIQAGADKVMLNAASLESMSWDIITSGGEHLGRQCMVIAIDALKSTGPEGYDTWDHLTRRPLGISPFALARKAEAAGAGEILLNSVDRDGAKTGYDLELAEKFAKSVSVPLILCGGVGHSGHLAEGLAVPKVAAVAAGNFFHFTEHSATLAKVALLRHNLPVRLDSYFNYDESPLDETGRLLKKSDARLKELLFEFHPKVEI